MITPKSRVVDERPFAVLFNEFLNRPKIVLDLLAISLCEGPAERTCQQETQCHTNTGPDRHPDLPHRHTFQYSRGATLLDAQR